MKKIALICLVLLCAAAAAEAQTKAKKPLTLNITTEIRNARAKVFGQKSAVLLYLKGRPETYIVKTADAPKFGLLSQELADQPDQAKMNAELEKVKGWKVKITLEPLKEKGSKEYRVLKVERLPEKPPEQK